MADLLKGKSVALSFHWRSRASGFCRHDSAGLSNRQDTICAGLPSYSAQNSLLFIEKLNGFYLFVVLWIGLPALSA